MTTTNNSVNVPLSGNTGTGNFAGSTSATFITPTLGAATATTLTFSPTTDGVAGTAAADNAGSGYVGEFVTSNIAYASSVTLLNTTSTDITSINLSAGDWDIYGNIFVNNTAHVATTLLGWVNTSSATPPDISKRFQLELTSATGDQWAGPVPYLRVNVSTSQTVYLSAYISAASGTRNACGTISARRIR